MGRLFGTDGVRGVANETLTCELALQIGRAAAMVLTDSLRPRPRVVLGADTRMSSAMLASAVTAGLCSVGADVLDLGVIPTPAVAYLVGKYKADAGIMISASHNPFEYNGIKIFSGDGYKLPDALEEEIEAIVLDHVKKPEPVIGKAMGRVFSMTEGVKDYTDHLKSTVHYSLEGLKVAVDCANGAASRTARRLFEGLGAECEILFDTPDGCNINDGCGSTHPEALQEYVVKHGMDVGVAFDGDADRCFCVDDQGNVVDGDFIMAICALDMKSRGKLGGNAIVGTVMTNLGFVRFCEENGIRFLATKVGDRFVLEQLLLEDYNFGGEQSGHIIFRDFATTGDGQLTAVQLLCQLRRTGEKLSDLRQCMTRYPQTTVNLTVSPQGKLAYYTDPVIRDAVEEAKAQLGDKGRIVVRASGTEPVMRVMVEHENLSSAEEVANRVARVVQDRLQDK